MNDDTMLNQAIAVLEREARLLDDRQWQAWLELYAADAEFWVPARRADETLTDDPQTELSHIYYASRAGLEDRVMRIASGASAASSPPHRTTHLLGNFSLEESASASEIRVRVSWVTHLFNVRSRSDHAFFGASLVRLRLVDGRWLIAGKKVLLQNDYVPTFIDVFCF